MKQRCRYNWERQCWDGGKLLTPEESARFGALSPVARDQFIATIVSSLRAKEDTKQRRTARFRAKHPDSSVFQ